MENQIIDGDCLEKLPDIEKDSIDCIVTDPPYGMSFMGKNWDKAVPSVAIWRECLRVLKQGAFAFVMCIPRQDCLAHMIVNLGDAGFNVAFSSIYWTYASGFPKAQNLSKVIDKRAGAEREVVGGGKYADKGRVTKNTSISLGVSLNSDITIPATPQAKALDGAYGGFQPKPAVEIIIVAMKPLAEKTYVDQAMVNMHGCTWLDDCRIPLGENDQKQSATSTIGFGDHSTYQKGTGRVYTQKGRFPANVLCEDNVLDDGRITKSTGGTAVRTETNVFKGTEGRKQFNCGDSGSFSRYFDLDAWFAERIKQLPKEAQKTFPWLIVPKASKGEKNKGCEGTNLKTKQSMNSYGNQCDFCSSDGANRVGNIGESKQHNNHPTCKPIKLMSWLIILGTREGDIILDPFVGSGTTCVAAQILGRRSKGIEREKEHCEIARKRISAIPMNLDEWKPK